MKIKVTIMCQITVRYEETFCQAETEIDHRFSPHSLVQTVAFSSVLNSTARPSGDSISNANSACTAVEDESGFELGPGSK